MSTPKLLDLVHQVARVRHLARQTDFIYANWIKRFFRFQNVSYPNELRESPISDFPANLATKKYSEYGEGRASYVLGQASYVVGQAGMLVQPFGRPYLGPLISRPARMESFGPKRFLRTRYS